MLMKKVLPLDFNFKIFFFKVTVGQNKVVFNLNHVFMLVLCLLVRQEPTRIELLLARDFKLFTHFKTKKNV